MRTKTLLNLLLLILLVFINKTSLVAEESFDELSYEAEIDNSFTQSKKYEIGDTGPAGGIIFYDKGEYSGGWRYLEAAPASTETRLPWSNNYKEIGGTKKGIGSGIANTQKIVEKHGKSNNYAAGYCASLKTKDGYTYSRWEMSCNGSSSKVYKDYFLPSKNELKEMYLKLYKANLGSFNYYSSSEYYASSAWSIIFFSGYQGYNSKGITLYVRCARAF